MLRLMWPTCAVEGIPGHCLFRNIKQPQIPARTSELSGTHILRPAREVVLVFLSGALDDICGSLNMLDLGGRHILSHSAWLFTLLFFRIIQQYLRLHTDRLRIPFLL